MSAVPAPYTKPRLKGRQAFGAAIFAEYLARELSNDDDANNWHIDSFEYVADCLRDAIKKKCDAKLIGLMKDCCPSVYQFIGSTLENDMKERLQKKEKKRRSVSTPATGATGVAAEKG